MSTKPYCKLPLSELEIGLIHVAVKRQIELMILKAKAGDDTHEQAFYARRADEYTQLEARISDVRMSVAKADTSQDPEPDDDEADEDPEG